MICSSQNGVIIKLEDKHGGVYGIWLERMIHGNRDRK